MRTKLALAVMTVPLAILAVGQSSRPADPERFRKVADRLVEAINSKDYPGARRDYSRVMSDADPVERSRAFYEKMTGVYGKIVTLGPARVHSSNTAVFEARCERGILDLTIVLDGEDKIIGLWFLRRRPDLPVPKEHQTRFRLPFKGRWLVAWGGDDEKTNQHHGVDNQRYAFDFIAVDARGNGAKGEGLSNDDYHAFGKEVLAPADGVVTDVIDGVRDNTPGSMNPYSGLGNAVFIEHRPNEVSVLAHLRRGSIRVKVGDKVQVGQVLGLCGNSGNSSQPHLHYHLQNTPVIQDGTGIKVFFERVIVNDSGAGKDRGRHSPVQNEVVSAD